MRSLILAATMSVCAMPSRSRPPTHPLLDSIPLALPAPVSPVSPSVALRPSSTVSGRSPSGGSPSRIGRTEPAIVAYVERSGGQISRLGTEHGMQVFAAREPDHFMVFDVTPDGEAMISGTVLQVPVPAFLSITDGRARELARVHGLRSFFLRSASRFQVFYATPDEQRLISGGMWDASGKNITREQLAGLPGMRPTVELGAASSRGNGMEARSAQHLLDLVTQTSFGRIGDPAAPLAYMFVDPQCSFSVRAFQELEPSIASGAIQLAVIPISILDREDGGLSTQRALSMVDEPRDEMVSDWSGGQISAPPGPNADSKLAANMEVAKAIDLHGTPTFIWRKSDGGIGRLDGVPSSPETLVAAVRDRS